MPSKNSVVDAEIQLPTSILGSVEAVPAAVLSLKTMADAVFVTVVVFVALAGFSTGCAAGFAARPPPRTTYRAINRYRTAKLLTRLNKMLSIRTRYDLWQHARSMYGGIARTIASKNLGAGTQVDPGAQERYWQC